MKPKVMIVGLGSLGGVLLELLARDDSIGKIVVATRNRAHAERRCNLARVGALAQGFVTAMEFVPLDLNDRAAAAETIALQAPDLVISTASLQTWWLAELLPAAARQSLSCVRFGGWLPMHLALALKFMDAVRAAEYRGHTVVASFPDVVNVVLGRLGMAPTCGVGNLDEIVPKIRLLAAEQLRVSPRSVRALLVAHHALEAFVFGARSTPDASRLPPDDVRRHVPPFFLHVTCGGNDVTGQLDQRDLLLRRYPLPVGPSWHFLTAGSTVRLIRALAGGDPRLVHVPGPLGLPGGYPVLANASGVHLAEIPGLSRDMAIEINERSHVFDGIERIDADGTVQVDADTSAAMRDLLSYNAGRLRPSDAEASAVELMARFAEFAGRHGVDIARAQATNRMM